MVTLELTLVSPVVYLILHKEMDKEMNKPPVPYLQQPLQGKVYDVEPHLYSELPTAGWRVRDPPD